MKLVDLCPIINKEKGFFIVDLKEEQPRKKFFQDSDDFYDSPYAKLFAEREVTWIEANENHLVVILN